MQFIDNLIILLLIALSFYAGKRMSDNYHNATIAELEFQLRLIAAQNGAGYIAPPQRKYMPIGQQFMDKLRKEGRATTKFRQSDVQQ